MAASISWVTDHSTLMAFQPTHKAPEQVPVSWYISRLKRELAIISSAEVIKEV